MARYIDAEALTDYMLERYSDFCEKYGDYDHYTTGYGDAIDVIEDAPTADVVPYLDDQHKQVGCYILGCKEGDKVKRMVAREIFEEIESEIELALESNRKAKREHIDKNYYCLHAEFLSAVQGKIDALRGIDDFIAELKKKYTEENK